MVNHYSTALQAQPDLKKSVLATFCKTVDTVGLQMPKRIDLFVSDVQRHKQVLLSTAQTHADAFWKKHGNRNNRDEQEMTIFRRCIEQSINLRLFSSSGLVQQLIDETNNLQNFNKSRLRGLRGHVWWGAGLEGKVLWEIRYVTYRKKAYETIDLLFGKLLWFGKQPHQNAAPYAFQATVCLLLAYVLYPTSSSEKPKEYVGLKGLFEAAKETLIEKGLEHIAGKKEEEMAHSKWWVAILSLVAICYVVSHFLVEWIVGSSQTWADVPHELTGRLKGATIILELCDFIQFNLEQVRTRLEVFQKDYNQMLTNIISDMEMSIESERFVHELNHEEFLEFFRTRSMPPHLVEWCEKQHIDGRTFVLSLVEDDFKKAIGDDDPIAVVRIMDLQKSARGGLYCRPMTAKSIQCLHEFLDHVVSEANHIKEELATTWKQVQTSVFRH